jgi:pantoate--beta-alanine ligase
MIKLIRDKNELKKVIKKNANLTTGFVPTMGNLHTGHISLLEQSVKENDISFISIFVNPAQFAESEDFSEYPRTLESDLEIISSIETSKYIIVYSPESLDDIYPKGFNSNIQVLSFNKQIEGVHRPSHFDGVATVVFKLLQLFGPTNAYFGQKDYQQFLVVKKLCYDFEIDTNIVLMPIVRDNDGLALSSRNQYLTPIQREEALTLRNTLLKVESKIKNNLIDDALSFAKETLQNTKWNYLEIKDAENLEEITGQTKNIIILGLYQQGETRLLDNILVKK